MRIRVQVIIESDQETAPPQVEEVACIERGALTQDSLGLRLSEAKQLLAGIQQAMSTRQVEEYVEGCVAKTRRERTGQEAPRSCWA